jgi:hypothetical protein
MAEKHEVGNAHVGMAWARVVEGGRSAGEGVRGGVLWAARERVHGATGLKLREALGVVRRVVEEKMEDLERKVEDAGVASTRR